MKMLSKIFVSYRRSDAFAADPLVRELRYRFGGEQVFQDVVSIESGQDFVETLSEQIIECDVLLVVIGKDWAAPNQISIKSNDRDWVRFELELARKHNKPIIPIVLSSGTIPSPSDLPESLHFLLNLHAASLNSGSDLGRDLAKLVKRVAEFVPYDSSRRVKEFAVLLAISAVWLFAASTLSSKFLFPSYGTFQFPNMIMGLIAGALPLCLLAAGIFLRIYSAKWTPTELLYQRRWLQLTTFFIIAGLLFGISLPAQPEIDEIFKMLESTRSETPRIKMKVDQLSSMPKYSQSLLPDFFEQVLQVRSNPDLTNDQVAGALNYFFQYRKSDDFRMQTWATLCMAEAYRFIEEIDKQIELYNDLTENPDVTDWQAWYAYNELGAINYVWKNNHDEARQFWEKALLHRETRGVLQNLAVIEEDSGNWNRANNYYERAAKIIENYKKEKLLVTLGYQEASLLSSWGNMLRLQYESGDQDESILTDAEAKLKLAIKAYPAYLDAHWNLANVYVTKKNYPDAIASLRSTLRTIRELKEKDPGSLDRHGYLEYGEAFTVWRSLVAIYKSKSAPTEYPDILKQFSKLVILTHSSPEAGVEYLLDRLEKHEYTVSDDRSDVQSMKNDGFLSSLVIE